MLRHVIAPAHSYAQIPNAILRHPKLSADAKTLLTWQLSLPTDAKQSLSETARRADIKKVAFQKAKQRLRETKYLHEWRVRLDSGRCVTIQLVSNEPLSEKEALAVRDGLQPVPSGARLQGPSGHRRPTATTPAAGQPTGRHDARQPQEDLEENTPPATTPARAPQPAAPAPAEHRDDGERLLRSLGYGEPRLAMSARTARRWAPLAAAWLDGGMPQERIRRLLTDGLADARNPMGVLRWRLEHALPDTPPEPAPALPAAAEPEPPRLRGMRECCTQHTQPRLFSPRPGHDDEHCADCRERRGISDGPAPPPVEGSGFTEFLAARRAAPRRPRSGER